MLNTVNYYPVKRISPNFAATAPQKEDSQPAHPIHKEKEGSFWDRNMGAIIGITSIALVGIAVMNMRNSSKAAEKIEEARRGAGHHNPRFDVDKEVDDILEESSSAGSFSRSPNIEPGDKLKRLEANIKKGGLLKKYEPQKSSPKTFDDVIGMQKEKAALKRLILDPLESSETKRIYQDEYGIELPSGILLEGSPGNGKTFLVQALSAKLGTDLYMMNMSQLGTKYIHETGANIEKALNQIKALAKIKGETEGKPVILFLDELDAMSRARGDNAQSHELEELNTLLQNINNLQDHNIILVGATNRKDLIDGAILRDGRFGEPLYVDNPDAEARESFLTQKMSKWVRQRSFLTSKADVKEVVAAMDGVSNSEINRIIRTAAGLAFEDGRKNVNKTHMLKAVEISKKTREIK